MTKRKFIKIIFLGNILLFLSSIFFLLYKFLFNINQNEYKIYSFNINKLKNGINEFEDKKIAIFKQNKNFYILSTICTHLGCTVKWDKKLNIFQCPCHQSAFSKNGKVIRGPAKKNLSELKYLIKNNENLIVWLKNS